MPDHFLVGLLSWRPFSSPLSTLMRRLLYLAAALLFILLFLGGPERIPFRSFRELWNLGHVVAFALWSAILLQFPPVTVWPWRRQSAVVLSFAFAFGLLSEGLQVWFARSPDVADLARDFLGAGTALALFAPSRSAMGRFQVGIMRAIVLLLLIVAAIPLAAAGTDDLQSWSRFPVLSDFESPLETGRWEEGRGELSRAPGKGSKGEGSLRIDLRPGNYSGASLKYFPRDWRGYRRLRLDLFNPGPAPLDLHIRIHDRHHRGRGGTYRDRFNAVRSVHPGWNDIEVDLAQVERAPRGRAMDMGGIESVGLFATDLRQRRTIYVDHVRLEKREP